MEQQEKRGYVQVYTGNGKGKTTASFGLALRAAGAGKKGFIGQFAKGQLYSEINAVHKFLSEYVTVRQYGLKCFLSKEPNSMEIDAARAGLEEMRKILASGLYDVVIMEEANIAVKYNLFTAKELIDAVEQRAPKTEVIITGRYASQEIMDYADLVTEMREVKHYYQKGVMARKGIEF